jgi:hypothetical protein
MALLSSLEPIQAHVAHYINVAMMPRVYRVVIFLVFFRP